MLERAVVNRFVKSWIGSGGFVFHLDDEMGSH